MPHIIKARGLRNKPKHKSHPSQSGAWLDGEKFGPYVSKSEIQAPDPVLGIDEEEQSGFDLVSAAPAAHDAILALLGSSTKHSRTKKRKIIGLARVDEADVVKLQKQNSQTLNNPRSEQPTSPSTTGLEQSNIVSQNNPFHDQFQSPTVEELKLSQSLLNSNQVHSTTTQYRHGSIYSTIPRLDASDRDVPDICLKSVLKERLQKSSATNASFLEKISAQPYCNSIFAYRDTCIINQDSREVVAYRDAYCLHALNHILKTRDLILKNNAKLAGNDSIDAATFRDQGFTRPKVLILLPTREKCLKTVEKLIQLLGAEQVENRKRLQEQFSIEGPDNIQHSSKPPDFKVAFAGNTDDNFRIGVKLTRQTIKLFSAFYSSDIILASPLGLKMAIDGKDKKDYDFLSSIEIIVIEDASALQMQNWQHVQYCFEHLNLLPKESHGCDYSRIRFWCLEELASCTRQLICYTDHEFPELRNLIQMSQNRSGRVTIQAQHDDILASTGSLLPHLFQRFESSDVVDDPQARFDSFTTMVLPRIKKLAQTEDAGLLVCFASYFDFVRVRNLLETQELRFQAISEYSSSSELTRARNAFATGIVPIMLMTERLHHYRRFEIKGIKRLYFYQVPQYARYYKELILAMIATQQPGEAEVRSLYSQWDEMSLSRLIGKEKRMRRMLTGKDSVFEFK